MIDIPAHFHKKSSPEGQVSEVDVLPDGRTIAVIPDYPAPEGTEVTFYDGSIFSRYKMVDGTWRVIGVAASTPPPAYDNSLYLGSGNSITTAYICGGAHRILIVAVFNNTNDASPSSVNYNGVAMTELTHQSGPSARLAYFYLPSPALGTHNIVVTMPGSDSAFAGALSVSNAVSQIVRNPAGDSNTSGSGASITVPSAANSLIVDAFYNDHSNCNATGGQTQVATSGGFRGLSFKAASAPSTAMSWTGATVGHSYEVAAEIVF